MVESKEKVNMQSLVSILDSLSASGFETQFKVTEQGLLSLRTRNIFQSGDVKIVHFYRFEGESDPSDSSVVYAIEASDGEKGTLVDGYGNSGDSLAADFVQKIKEIYK